MELGFKEIFAFSIGTLMLAFFTAYVAIKVRRSAESLQVDPLQLAQFIYFSKLKSGPGIGFAMVLLTEPYDHYQKNEEVFHQALSAFNRRFFTYDPDREVFPEALQIGWEYRLGGCIILIGHPLRQSPEYQLTLVRKYIREWFNCLDEVSQGSVKGFVSIAHGKIVYTKREQFYLGSFTGETYYHAVQVIDDAVNLHGSWPKASKRHRLAANKAAMDILFTKRTDEKYHAYHDSSYVMYGIDFDDSLLI